MAINWEPWFDGKTLTTDWVSPFFNSWIEALGHRQHEHLRILELGTWEGRSAIFFAEFFHHAQITCVDTFCGGIDIDQNNISQLVANIEKNFDANTSSYGHRITKHKTTTLQALAGFTQIADTFDVIFLDASHQRDDVMLDTLLAWSILAPDGTMIFDDYDCPTVKPAIDTFLAWHGDELQIIRHGYQLIIRRTK